MIIRATCLAIGVGIAALITAPAHALIEPPARYDKIYRGGTTIIEQPNTAAVTAECKRRLGITGKHGNILGCAKPSGGKCIVIIPNRAFIATMPLARQIGPAVFRDILVRHERAHCNGWNADHRGGREVTP